MPVVVLATLAVLVTAADTYVVVLALPDILTGVGIGLDELQRATPIIGGFLLGYTATLPLLGRLADLRGPRAGARRLPAAVRARLAADGDRRRRSGAAVLGRGLQGIGAGGLVPATLALVADRWPPERRSLPLGVVGAVQEAGAVLGPLAGAAVLAVADWRAIFWLNLLLGLGPGRRRRWSPARGRRPDPVGLVLAAVAVPRARPSSWPRRPLSPRTSPSACSTCPSCRRCAAVDPAGAGRGRRRARRWSPAA